MKASTLVRILIGSGALIGAAAIGLRVLAPGALTLLARGEAQTLPAAATVQPSSPTAPRLLVLAIDGVDRDLLYPMLEEGSLPELAQLLGGNDGARFEHAYFDRSVLSTLPSSTLAAWATIFTGEPPAKHGVAGNEYFVRETRVLAAPAPVSLPDLGPVAAIYTEGYANGLLAVPSVYDAMRARDASADAWVSTSQFYGGASKLLLADRTVVAAAFKGLIEGVVDADLKQSVFARLDGEAVDTVEDALRDEPAPRVLSVYLTGTDHVAHGSEEGPDASRRRYLREVTDSLVGRLHRALLAADGGAPRWVVVVSDHGHTAVVHDARHALSTNPEDDPPAVVQGAGFRLRPFELEVADDHDFQAVLAYGGAMAYAYVADRSTCEAAGSRCDFTKPPRLHEDVLPLAQAFHEANQHGRFAPSMQHSLDMILVREPRPFEQDDLPFQVYLGEGRMEPLEAHLRKHPRRHYVRFAERLRELAVGRFGERAGDVLLLARNGDEDDPDNRFYFASEYRSWHGSPSKADSAITCIVGHAGMSARQIEQRVGRVLGPKSTQADVGRLLIDLAVTP